MIWLVATAMMVVAAPFILWPLLTHWTPEGEAGAEPEVDDVQRRELEELELDIASGRISEGEAARRRREQP
jgi:cytochrome c-type biogenesis protein CcmI